MQPRPDMHDYPLTYPPAFNWHGLLMPKTTSEELQHGNWQPSAAAYYLSVVNIVVVTVFIMSCL